MSGPRALRIAQLVGGVAALALLGYVAVSAWRELSAERFSFDWLAGIVALGALSAAFLFTVGLWKLLLGELGVRITFPQTLQLWSFSNLGRYLPGKVWQVAGLVVVARDLGVPPGTTATAGFLALAFMIGTGAAAALVLFPAATGPGSELAWVRPVGAFLAAGLLVPVARPDVVTAFVRRLPRFLGCSAVPDLSRAAVVRLVLAFAGSWLAQGAAFHLFVRAFGNVPASSYLPLSGLWALAYVAGLLAFFAPGGIGVREGILAHLLALHGGVAAVPAAAVAISARLWAIAAEVVLLAGALAFRARAARRPVARRKR